MRNRLADFGGESRSRPASPSESWRYRPGFRFLADFLISKNAAFDDEAGLRVAGEGLRKRGAGAAGENSEHRRNGDVFTGLPEAPFKSCIIAQTRLRIKLKQVTSDP
jgi:hypothetical protein